MIHRVSIYLKISQSLRIILTLMIVLWLPFFLTRVSRVDQLICIYTGQGASHSASQRPFVKLVLVFSMFTATPNRKSIWQQCCFGRAGENLYMRNHGLGLPSINTIQAKAQITHLLPSLRLPTPYELWHTLHKFFGRSHIVLPLCGHSIFDWWNCSRGMSCVY